MANCRLNNHTQGHANMTENKHKKYCLKILYLPWKKDSKDVLTGPYFILIVKHLFKKRFYLFIWQRASTIWRRRNRLPTEQGVLCGAGSQDPGIMT